MGVLQAQMGGSRADFDKLIAGTVDKSLDIFLKAAKGEDAPQVANRDNLLKTGQLAKLSSQSVSTLKHWTEKGLLENADQTDKGYYLYSISQADRIKEVLEYKAARFSLDEIKLKVNK